MFLKNTEMSKFPFISVQFKILCYEINAFIELLGSDTKSAPFESGKDHVLA